MTCIVAVKGNGKIVIGGDSAGVSGLDVCVRKDPKVFRVGDFVIGFTSSFRMGQALMDLKVPAQKKGEDDYAYMRTTFVKTVQKLFEKAGFLKTEHDQKSGGTFLVIYRNEIYKIEEDFQVEVRYDPYNACGCGEGYALGALAAYSVGNELIQRPRASVERALSIAERFSGGVRAPWTIIEIPHKVT